MICFNLIMGGDGGVGARNADQGNIVFLKYVHGIVHVHMLCNAQEKKANRMNEREKSYC